MLVLARVATRVTVGGVIAATDVPALQADPQVQPHPALTQAVLTAIDGFRELLDSDRVHVAARHAQSMTQPRESQVQGEPWDFGLPSNAGERRRAENGQIQTTSYEAELAQLIEASAHAGQIGGSLAGTV